MRRTVRSEKIAPLSPSTPESRRAAFFAASGERDAARCDLCAKDTTLSNYSAADLVWGCDHILQNVVKGRLCFIGVGEGLKLNETTFYEKLFGESDGKCAAEENENFDVVD